MTMKPTLLIGLALAGALLGRPVLAAETPANDCLIGIQDEDGAVITGDVTCKDGDASCDDDGAKNNSCTFKVKGCLNMTDPACTQRVLKKFKFKTKPNRATIVVTPVTGDTAQVCGDVVDMQVPLKTNGKKPGKLTVNALAKADVKPAGQNKYKDKIKFTCNPCPAGDATCEAGSCGAPQATSCPNNPAGGPDELTLTVADTGNDLDTGFSGQSHNFINVAGAKLTYCLTECDGTTDSVCKGSGPTGTGTKNTKAFGPPLPLFSAGVAVCVVNEFAEPTIDATIDVQTGAFDASAKPLKLNAKTHQSSPDKVCPRCIGGQCDSGARQGQSCTVGGTVVVNNPPNVVNVTYNVSADCLPSASALLGTPVVNLGLTTATSTLDGNANGNGLPCPGQQSHDSCGNAACTVDCSAKSDPKGGINQTCCSNTGQTPCFPTNLAETGVGKIERTGSVTTPPASTCPGSDYPKTGSGVLASAFCIASTSSIAVDGTAGLPGPGALLLPGTAVFSDNP